MTDDCPCRPGQDRFAIDSPLERNGFELPVPRQIRRAHASRPRSLPRNGRQVDAAAPGSRKRIEARSPGRRHERPHGWRSEADKLVH